MWTIHIKFVWEEKLFLGQEKTEHVDDCLRDILWENTISQFVSIGIFHFYLTFLWKF